MANVKAARRIADGIFKKAAGLIAISECTRADAVRLLDLAPEKIDVIYPGIAPAFFDVDKNQAAVVARRYGLEKPFVLYVGTIEPRKNLAMLLEAWRAMSREVREQFDLAIAGSWGWGDPTIYDRLEAGVDRGSLSGLCTGGRLCRRSRLPPPHLSTCRFTRASAYRWRRRWRRACPIVASNVSALPEVAGDAALLVDPRSRQEVRSSLERLLLSPSLRAQLTDRGRARAREFTWEACARKSWEFFRRVAA